MADIKRLREALVRRILEGAGRASPSERRAAFENSGLPGAVGVLVDKVAARAYAVSEEDFHGAISLGLSEDQVFEMVVCAAVGQASQQYEAAMAALEAASGKK